MKILFDWKLVMVIATILMTLGFTGGIWGIYNDNDPAAIGGLISVIVICVLWWLWVMYIIASIIKTTEITIENLEEVKEGIKEVKVLIIDYKVLNDKYINKG